MTKLSNYDSSFENIDVAHIVELMVLRKALFIREFFF